MNDGAMQYYGLTLDKFLSHAAKWHTDAEVVSGAADGAVQRISYGALYDRARGVSGALRALGIGPGDRVATLAWNTQGHLEAWYGIMGMGAICHTLNPRLTAAQLGAMLAQSQAALLLASPDLLALAREASLNLPAMRGILLLDTDEGAEKADALGPLIAGAPRDTPWGDFAESAPSGLCFTSGSTGAPKGVTYTHRGCYLHTMRQLQADVLGPTSRDAILAVVPMFHANAWGLPFAAPAVGAKLVLPGRHSDGAHLARLIRAEGVTAAAGVPTVWLGLVEHLEAEGGEVASLERILVGGSPMPPALMERIERRLGVEVQTSWGMTELSPLGTAALPGDPHRRASLSGRPAIGIDLLVTDADGRPLPEQRCVEGHLRVRGGTVVERYFGQSEPATDANGWFDTGDLARIDRSGNLTITGRAKDLIKSGGEWINPAEIEALVGALPQVSLAAVIGRPDPKWGERPILLVETCDSAISDDELLAPLAGRVASWWVPDAVIRLAAMPLAPTGKIDKMQLRAEYGQV
ncbi:AMP-binding protein [Sphingosinicella microcystinivorans]|uniref:AMP-binding protein n=1 Tax=Sphingosinicella microcystinivorans TaxID=335406 RepID=UPI0022F3BCAA|nr:AMP-binding protein [Sphingosinicella microcystinivorans]WBX84555.1 AMP-binding protein [Sphingosinicella microcystinivorans]